MTSTRRLQTYAERESRTGQYDPGHVGGRVASAQPIRRRGGTLRERAVGAAGAPAEIDTGALTWADYPPGYTWADHPAGVTWADLDQPEAP